MKIRSDFVEVASQLERLLLYAQEAEKFDCDDWHRLKTKEDYNTIFCLDSASRTVYENIYSTGRELAMWLASHLGRFNNVGSFPTLKSFVDSFDNTWIHQTDHLHSIIAKAQEHSTDDEIPWAIRRMIDLFQKEISILDSLKVMIDQMKDSELYQSESGNRILKGKQNEFMSNNITFNSASNVQIGNQNSQSISQVFNALLHEIEHSNASEKDKEEARSKLQAFIEHPLVCSILGGVVGGVVGGKG